MAGSITLITGCMFAGKTTELLRVVNRHSIADKKCLVIKHAEDNRYNGTFICSHDMILGGEQHGMTIKTSKLSNVDTSDFDVVAVDEGQFFEDLKICNMWANQGKTVVVSALSTTYNAKSFDSVTDIYPFCEKVVKLTAVCSRCKSDNAIFSKYKGCSSTDSKLFDPNLVGGSELYSALCRDCYFGCNSH